MSIGKLFIKFVAIAGVALFSFSPAHSASHSKGSIVSFNGPAGEAYIGRFIKGIKATAELKGFDIRYMKISLIRQNRINRYSRF